MRWNCLTWGTHFWSLVSIHKIFSQCKNPCRSQSIIHSETEKSKGRSNFHLLAELSFYHHQLIHEWLSGLKSIIGLVWKILQQYLTCFALLDWLRIPFQSLSNSSLGRWNTGLTGTLSARVMLLNAKAWMTAATTDLLFTFGYWSGFLKWGCLLSSLLQRSVETLQGVTRHTFNKPPQWSRIGQGQIFLKGKILVGPRWTVLCWPLAHHLSVWFVDLTLQRPQFIWKGLLQNLCLWLSLKEPLVKIRQHMQN